MVRRPQGPGPGYDPGCAVTLAVSGGMILFWIFIGVWYYVFPQYWPWLP